jgi:hypothetical protein
MPMKLKKQTCVPHIRQEGARFHVISFFGGKNPDGSRLRRFAEIRG